MIDALKESAPVAEPCASRVHHNGGHISPWFDKRGGEAVAHSSYDVSHIEYSYAAPQQPPAPEHVERLVDALLDAHHVVMVEDRYGQASREQQAAYTKAEAALLAAYRPAAVSGEWREVAEHLRGCVECGETDVMRCHEGRKLWEAAVAAAPVQSAGEAWQPIETAPKDGSIILIYGPRIIVQPAHWTTSGAGFMKISGWSCGAYLYEASDPTHWQPLPAAPTCPPEVCSRCGGKGCNACHDGIAP